MLVIARTYFLLPHMWIRDIIADFNTTFTFSSAINNNPLLTLNGSDIK
jgi:hypothetical protein